jgi:hypothetical protein
LRLKGRKGERDRGRGNKEFFGIRNNKTWAHTGKEPLLMLQEGIATP